MKKTSSIRPTKPQRRPPAHDQPPLVHVAEDPDLHLIRLQLAKPPHERTHFLRVPLANGGSCL